MIIVAKHGMRHAISPRLGTFSEAEAEGQGTLEVSGQGCVVLDRNTIKIVHDNTQVQSRVFIVEET